MSRFAVVILSLVAVGVAAAAHAPPPCGGLDGAWLSESGLDLLQFDGDALSWSELTPFGRIEPPLRLAAIGNDREQWRFDRERLPELRFEMDEGDADHLLLRRPGVLLPERFMRLARVPDAARQVAPSDPATVFDAMAAIVRAECPCLAPRKVDWDALVAGQRAKIDERTTPKQLFSLMTGALDAIDDAHFALAADHVGFWDEAGPDGKRFTEQTRLDRLRTLIDERYAMAPFKQRCIGTIRYGRLANLVGYVRIESFDHPGSSAGLASEEEAHRFVHDLDEIMRELDFVESLVLDLRFNLGGHPSAVAEIASRFMKPGAALLTSFRRSDPKDLEALRGGSPIVADAVDHPRFLRRLLILTSHNTCSGGEVLPLALLGRDPPATRIGEATQGALCGVASRRLPNGWDLRLTSVLVRSAKSESFEARGLPPDVPVALFAGMDAKPPKDEALEQALALVGER